MWGVESTRAPSCPRKSMATSVVTRIFFSLLVPIGIFAMDVSGGGQSGKYATHVTKGPVHSRERILVVYLVFQIHAALIIHLLELLEKSRKRQVTITNIALAGLFGDVF